MKSISNFAQFALVLIAAATFLYSPAKPSPQPSPLCAATCANPTGKYYKFTRTPKQTAAVEPTFTQPAPPTPAAPKAKAVAAPAGYYRTVYAGIGGRRSYQVWVPASGAACGPGGCAAPAYYSRGCSSCR